MPAPMMNSAPGWYPDPGDGTRERWWDGSAWTERVRSPGAPDQAFAKARSRERAVAIIGGAVAVLIVIVAVVVFRPSGGGSDSETSSTAPALGAVVNGVSSTTAAVTTVDPAKVFTDPAGGFSIQPGPDWVNTNTGLNGTSSWSVGEPTGPVMPTVTVAVENLPRNGSTLDDYIDVTRKNLAAQPGNPRVISDDRITLPNGTVAALLQVQGTVNGTQVRQELLAVLRGSRVALVVVTAAPSVADDVFAAVDPYIQTVALL